MDNECQEIKIKNTQGISTEIEINGQKLHHVVGYIVRQKAGERPQVTLDLIPAVILETKCTLAIEHLSDLARVMDENTFNEFCVMWNSLHGSL